MIHTNGSSVQKIGGVGNIITTLEGDALKYGVQLQFLATHNEAEYEAILIGLRDAKALEAKNVLLKCDSRLMIGQINGKYEAKENRMQNYLKLTDELIGEFDKVRFM